MKSLLEKDFKYTPAGDQGPFYLFGRMQEFVKARDLAKEADQRRYPVVVPMPKPKLRAKT